MASKVAKVGGGGVTIDTSSLDRFARQLKSSTPQMRKRFRDRMKQGLEVVADDARGRAGEFSTSIPMAIRSRSSITTKGVNGYVEVPKGRSGAAGVAVLFEFGNSTKRHGYAGGGSTSFRHPVFNSSGQKSRGASKTGGAWAADRGASINTGSRNTQARKKHGSGWGWATQNTHPFMRPALAAKREVVIELIDQAIKDTVSDLSQNS